jgi:hypothetical protein
LADALADWSACTVSAPPVVSVAPEPMAAVVSTIEMATDMEFESLVRAISESAQ